MGGRRSHTRHLVQRFFSVLTAKRLTAAEVDEVENWLGPDDRVLFWAQDVADQRHALDTVHRVQTSYPADVGVIRAALFHDVGKIHSRLGPLRRSLATLAVGARLPIPSRWDRYRRHGPLGAADLERIGAEHLVVAFARLHPGPGPGDIDRDIWQALLDADHD